MVEDTDVAVLKKRASRVGLGTWAIGGTSWGGTDKRDAIRTLHAALDMGINLVDTAPIYGHGVAEELIGEALAESGRRDEVVLATKAGLEWDGGIVRNSSRDRIMRDLEGSLRRLRTDYIDIYQIHWPDPSRSFHEPAEVMLRLWEEGRIRAIGVSNFSPEQCDAFREVAPIHTMQPPYNLLERDIEIGVLPYCMEHDIVMMGYGVLCRGLLSGRMGPDTEFRGDDIRKIDPKFQPPRYEQYLSVVDELDRFAQQTYGKRVIHLAPRWVLDQGLQVALWGARHPAQLQPIQEAMGWNLDPAGLQAIDDILELCIAEPIGPEFMAPPVASPAASESGTGP